MHAIAPNPTDPHLIPMEPVKAPANVLPLDKGFEVRDWLKSAETRTWLDEKRRTRDAIAKRCTAALGFVVTESNIKSVAHAAKVSLVPPAPAPEVPVTRGEFDALMCAVHDLYRYTGHPAGPALDSLMRAYESTLPF